MTNSIAWRSDQRLLETEESKGKESRYQSEPEKHRTLRAWSSRLG